MPPGTIFGGYEAYAQCAGRAARPGGVKSLEGDGSETAGAAFSRAGSKSVQIGEGRGSAGGSKSRLHGHLGAGESRWHATSPAHPLAVAVHERVDAKASLQRRGPPQWPRLSQPFLPQQGEDRIVCLALHARREEPEVPNVVPVAVGDVIGERGQELGRGIRSLDGAFGARVLRHKSDFLTGDRPEPVLRVGFVAAEDRPRRHQGAGTAAPFTARRPTMPDSGLTAPGNEFLNFL